MDTAKLTNINMRINEIMAKRQKTRTEASYIWWARKRGGISSPWKELWVGSGTESEAHKF
jgi:hypothetical protein